MLKGEDPADAEGIEVLLQLQQLVMDRKPELKQ